MTAAQTQTKFQQAYKLASEGKAEAACTILLKLVAQSPDHFDTLSMLAAVLCRLGRFEQALYYAERAVTVDKGSRASLTNRANVLMLMNRPAEGARDLRAALALDPGNMNLRCTLTHALLMLNRGDEALQVLEEVKDRLHQYNPAAAAYAGVLQMLGRADEALAVQRSVLERIPDDAGAAERVLTSAIYAWDVSNEQIKEAAARYGRLISQKMPVSRLPHANSRDPDRRIRIGFLGPDFREHASMRFFEPLASSYDRSKLEFRCYMTVARSSATTERIRSKVDAFANIAEVPAAKVDSLLRKDGVDILIDLSGHTTGHRVEVFHHKPAPVQCTWYGQPVTCGLTGIDYRIVDSVTDPVGTESHNIERLLRIDPCSFAFWPAPGTPPVQDPPSQRDDSPTRGTIVFGCYGNLMKMNARTFNLWARLLEAVPGSRLVLRHTAFGTPGTKRIVLDMLSAAGVAADRVVVGDPAPNPAAMMNAYQDIDISLDTFPYCGMTTTCESLTMGVPMVTLPLNRSVSRYSESILRFVGLPELIARDEDDYVRIAAGLAGDPARLKALRHELRPRMERTVSDAPAFAVRFEEAMRRIWREWCARGA